MADTFKHLAHGLNMLEAAKAALLLDRRTNWPADDAALASALDLIDDAISELRGEWNAREPEYPLTDRGAA